MRTALGLYAFAALVRLVLIALYPDPAYVDSYYYVDVARALQAGHGFNIDFIWTFVDLGGSLPAHPVLPIPSNAHWMPLAALVQVPFLAVLGPTAWASALPFALIGSLAAPMTWAFATETGARRDVALGAGLLIAVPAAVVFMAQPDNFSLYQPIVLGALWLGARGLNGSPRAFLAAGGLVGLAMLARNDGVLVGAALGLLFVCDRYRAWRAARPAALPWWSAIASLGLFVLVMAPWWARQLAVFGSLSPSSASGRILWIRSLSEMNSIEGHPTLQTFLDQGFGSLVSSRLVGFAQAVVSFVILVAGVVLAPTMAAGAWVRRRSPTYRPFFVYAVLLFAFSALVSAVHVPNGTFIHSAVALAPQASILALEGVIAVVAWIAARRAGWDVAQASRTFVAGAVGMTMLVGVWFSFTTRSVWAGERDLKVGAGAALTCRCRTGRRRDEPRHRRGQVLDRPSRRGRAGRSDRHDRDGRPGVRRTLAAGREEGHRGRAGPPARRRDARARLDRPERLARPDRDARRRSVGQHLDRLRGRPVPDLPQRG